MDAELDKEEQILAVKLAPEQRLAVKTALTHGISIITGGPGTGKTMIQRALLDIYKRNHPGNEICCCAHAIMLTRPLIYTAITRGKKRVIIVGERRALCMAIKKKDTEKRGTCLAKRLKEYY